MIALLRSANARGEMPSWSAPYVIGVPCSSVPLTISTRAPRSRWYRANTSEGTPKPATWPMWRGPLAYGQATDIRMRSLALMRDDKRNLASHGLAKGGQHLRGRPAGHLLVHLGQLASQCDGPLRQRLGQRAQRTPDAKGRLERDGRPVRLSQPLEEPAQLP